MVFGLCCIANASFAQDKEYFEDKLINLGTALEEGLFYPLGVKICDAVNAEKERTSLRCVAMATGGPNYNIAAVSSGQLQAAFTYSATTSTPFPGNITKLVSLYQAPIVLISKQNSGINTPEQLRGLRVNIGGPSSPIRALSNIYLKSAHLEISDLQSVPPQEIPNATDAFCKNELDVIIGGLPLSNPYYDRLVNECGAKLISLSDAFIQTALKVEPRLQKQQYDLTEYGLGNQKIDAIGQEVILITNTELSSEALQRLKKSLGASLKLLSSTEVLLKGWTPEFGFSPANKDLFSYQKNPTSSEQLKKQTAFKDKLINLGTAAEGGVFYSLGQDICSELNNQKDQTLIRCVAKATGGIDFNIQAVSSGMLQAAFSFSATTKYPFPENIKKIVNLYDAPIVLIVKKGMGISSPEQLIGKRVNVGTASSAKRRVVNTVLTPAHIKVEQLAPTPPMETPAAVAAFCNNELDAFIEALPIPNNFYTKLMNQCGGEIIQFNETFLDAAIQIEPRLEKQHIDLQSLNLGTEKNFATIGQSVVLITHSKLNDEAVRRLVSSVNQSLKKMSHSEILLSGWDEDYGFKKSGGLPLIFTPAGLKVDKK